MSVDQASTGATASGAHQGQASAGTGAVPDAGNGASATVLSVRGLRVAYGGIQAVKGIDLEVRPGELVALIGANGAGKTTTLGAISATLPWTGEIALLGQSTRGLPAHALLRAGLALVPEGRGIFTRMTVAENLAMGAYTRRDRDGIQADLHEQYENFPRLRERAGQLAGNLSGGEQQMLAMARALMSRPRLLLLDEPSMGLSPIMVDRIFEVIRAASKKGLPILLVEQNARLALESAHRAYVLDSGAISLGGDAATLANDPRVREAYLGE
jgi:branched-chain amino acid transport system ATP-binding protein